jgi:hypothetical protein
LLGITSNICGNPPKNSLSYYPFDAKVISIEGDTATIDTNLGTVETNVENVEGLIGIDKTAKNTYMTSLAFTILAAVITIVIIFIVKKKLT